MFVGEKMETEQRGKGQWGKNQCSQWCRCDDCILLLWHLESYCCFNCNVTMTQLHGLSMRYTTVSASLNVLNSKLCQSLVLWLAFCFNFVQHKTCLKANVFLTDLDLYLSKCWGLRRNCLNQNQSIFSSNGRERWFSGLKLKIWKVNWSYLSTSKSLWQ